MAKTKQGRSRGFRPRPDTERRLEYAETLGINISELVNDVLDKHLRDALIKHVQSQKDEIERRRNKLREALNAPVP